MRGGGTSPSDIPLCAQARNCDAPQFIPQIEGLHDSVRKLYAYDFAPLLGFFFVLRAMKKKKKNNKTSCYFWVTLTLKWPRYFYSR